MEERMSKKRYPVRIPRFAAGIRAQEMRSGGGRSWWGMRWMAALEEMGLKGRLGRARNYAVGGQVVSVEVAGGDILAKVVGTRPDPYEVKLVFRRPEGACRRRIIDKIRAEPMLVARILANDLPMEVAEIFSKEGFDLFPGKKLAPGKYDMTSSCSCPDWANPCKHVTAVLLVLGEEVSRRPAMLLELRGIGEEDLCDED